MKGTKPGGYKNLQCNKQKMNNVAFRTLEWAQWVVPIVLIWLAIYIATVVITNA